MPYRTLFRPFDRVLEFSTLDFSPASKIDMENCDLYNLTLVSHPCRVLVLGSLHVASLYLDLSALVDIGGTFLASSVECERGFSLLNSIKTKQRNRLGEEHLDMIMRVKSYEQDGCAVDKAKVYEEWVSRKDRREKVAKSQ